MSDVKDILGVREVPKSGHAKLEDIMSPNNKKKKVKEVEKEKTIRIRRSGGLTLPLSEAPPSLLPTSLAAPSPFKEKRKLTHKVEPWVWKPFRNPARKDGLVLHHWAKADEEVEDYVFAKFNKRITMFDYTNEQYEQFFNNDPNWTKEQTDELWNLCKQYDLRFTVITDRFSSDKTIEDIKDRYYSISKKLLQLNATPEEDISKHPLIKFPYNKEHEVERKKQYERLYSRTAEQIEEEKKLIAEYKRIETNLKKQQKEKKRALKLTSASLSSFSADGKRNKKKKKDEDDDYDEEAFLDAPPMTQETAAALAAKASRKEKSNGVYNRSTTILAPLPVSNKLGKRVDEILVEVGIGLRPMPTAAICKLYNDIRNDILALINIQKAVASKEYQVQLLRDRKQALLSGKVEEGSASTPIPLLVEPRMSTPSLTDPYSVELLDTPVASQKMKKRPHSSGKSEKKPKKKKDTDFE